MKRKTLILKKNLKIAILQRKMDKINFKECEKLQQK
jgi:hypothetical protein